jgi:hypothetical protein
VKQRWNQRGQELVELGITIVLFMTIALGVITFGHAFMAANMITHAARDGARVAATWPQRGPCGALCDGGSCTPPFTSQSNPIIQVVKNEISTVLGSTAAGTFTYTVSQNPIPPTVTPCGSPPPTPTVTVNVNGCVPWAIPFLLPVSVGTPCNGSTGFAVNRTIVFHDEGLKY